MTSPYFNRRRQCPACKSEEYKEIYSCQFNKSPIKEYLESFYLPQGRVEFEYLTHSIFILIECNHCGLIYQQEIANDFLMAKIYEEWIDPVKTFELSKTNALDDYMYYAQEIIPIISYFNALPSQLKFLDFGMGWGQWCQIVKAFGVESYGTEISKARVEHAEENGIKSVLWGDLQKHNFHFINTEQVFEHIAEPLETLIYLKKCLRPQGLLKISVPNGANIKRRLRICDWKAPKGSKNSLNSIAPLEHINCFTYESIIKMATMAGFQQVKLPLRIQYAYSIHGKTLRQILKSLIKPLYRNMVNTTYIFLRQSGAH